MVAIGLNNYGAPDVKAVFVNVRGRIVLDFDALEVHP
jgi:hypothetical protein